MISRADWSARPPKNRAARLAAPLGVTYHWGGPAVGVRSHADCARKVRGWQTFHMDGRGWADIAYNLVVCPHGDVFEGRGINARSAANGTNIGNSSHYAICYLGGKGEPLTDAGKRGLLEARAYLMAEGGAGPQVRTHNSWKKTGCPGHDLEQWIGAGCPTAGPPEPPPPTPPADPEVDSMKAQLLTTGDRRFYLATAERGAWPVSHAQLQAARAAGLVVEPGREVTAEQIDTLMARYAETSR